MAFTVPIQASPAAPIEGNGAPAVPGITVKQEVVLPNFMDVYTEPIRILLIGLTGTGKTTLIGELAKHIYLTKGKRTVLNVIDRGTPESIQHLIDAGIIITNYLGTRDPFIWLDRATRGQIVDKTSGKWIAAPDDVELYAFDSASGAGEEQLKAMRDSQKTDSPIGPKAYTFSIREGDQTMTVGTSDKSHYGITQGRIVDAMWESDNNIKKHIIWTAGLRRVDQDDDTKLPLLGPDLAGKALVGTAPRWFKYTWCLTATSSSGHPNRHVLHLASYQDMQMAGSQVVGNARVPQDGKDFKIPAEIEPASLVKALGYLAGRKLAAKAEIMTLMAEAKLRLGL
jgi:hypothetical protein